MRTNTARQQATRRMTNEQKVHNMALLIAQNHEVNEAHAARFKAIVAMWQHAEAAGLTPDEMHALDMALMRGEDPAVLSTTF